MLTKQIGPSPIKPTRQRTMKHRHQRRALPADGNVGRAQVVHHRNLRSLRQRCTVADLHRQPLLGPMQHGLAVKADDVDAVAGDVVALQEILDRLRVRGRDQTLGIGETPGRSLRLAIPSASASPCRSSFRSSSL